jgi:hypothetical protein
MPIDLRIHFSGLCAYLYPANDQFDVVLVDARHPTDPQHDAGMHPHFPKMSVSTGHLAELPEGWLPEQMRQPSQLVPDMMGDVLAIFDLDFEEITIPTSTRLFVHDDARPGEIPGPNPAERQTLGWTASLDQLGFTQDKLRPECTGPLSSDGKVVARIHLNGGTVSCDHIFQREQAFIRWSFDPPPALPLTQALGDIVVIDMTLPSPDEVSNFKGHIISTTQPPLVLEPLENERIDLVFGNIIGHLLPETDAIPHFGWYYELLTQPPEVGARPIPRRASGAMTTSKTGCAQATGRFRKKD